MTQTRDQLLYDEREIAQLADLLFIYTDEKDWKAAQALYVDGPIGVDMSSLNGGGPTQMTAQALFAGFDQGLHADKPSHHMTTNYRITVTGNTAELFAHGYSWNQLLNYTGGTDLWETWGTYRLTFRRTPLGWKMDGFRYDAKYNRGNEFVRTHTLDAQADA